MKFHKGIKGKDFWLCVAEKNLTRLWFKPGRLGSSLIGSRVESGGGVGWADTRPHRKQGEGEAGWAGS
jgi:hypothetical protein